MGSKKRTASKAGLRRKQNKIAKDKTIRHALLRKGDLVMVIAGGHKIKRPNKGQVGKILAFVGDAKDRAIVEGLNMLTKHLKQTAPGKPSGKIKKEAGIHISNLMFYVEKLKKPVRLKVGTLQDGKKVRGYKDESGQFVQI